MTRKVYLVAEIDTTRGSLIISTKTYTTYQRAVEAFKVKVADRFIFDSIYNLRIEDEPVTGANIIEMYKDNKFYLTDIHGEPCDVPLTEKEFDETGGEITLMVDTAIITLRNIEEET